MLKSVEEEWEGFSAMVFSGMEPSDTQKAEMKKSFFAGAWAMLTAIEEIGMPYVSAEDAEKYLEARSEEIKAFKDRIMREYAEKN